MGPLEIYTSGDMAFMEAILTGLGHVYSDGFMGQIFAMALLANALMSLARYIADSKSGFLTSFWQAIVLYLVMFSSTVNIVLMKDNEASRPIAGDFPVGVVLPAYYVSLIGNKIASRMRENIIAIDVGFGFSSNTAILDNGMGPLQALVHMRNFKVVGSLDKSDLLSDPNNPGNASSGLSTSIGNYFEDCVEKAAALTRFDPNGQRYIRKFEAMSNAEDAWKNILVDQPWPTTTVLDGITKIRSCEQAHEDIGKAMDLRSQQAIKAAVFETAKTRSDLEMQDHLLAISGFWESIDPMNTAKSLNKIHSNLITNVLLKGACKDSVLMGAQFVQSCRAQFDAIQKRRFDEGSKAESFLEMLGPMITFIEGFVYAISPFMILLVLFSGAAGLKMMGKYFTALLWVVLIPICQVVVDVYLNTYFNRWLYTALHSDLAGSNLASISAQESIWTELESFVAFAGTAQAMVPALAMFIIFAGVHTLQGMGSGMASGAVAESGSLTASKGATVKGGVINYAGENAKEIRGQYGQSYSGETSSATSSNVDASATDYSKTIGGQEMYNHKYTQQRSLTTAAGVKAEATATDAYGKDWKGSHSFDTSSDWTSTMSRQQAEQTALSKNLQSVFKLSESTADEIATQVQAAGGLGGSLSFGSLQDLKLTGQAKGELSSKIGDVTKSGESASLDKQLADLNNRQRTDTKAINDQFSEAMKRGDSAVVGDSITEKEQIANAANINHNRQLSTLDAFDSTNALSKASNLSMGKFINEASANGNVTKQILTQAEGRFEKAREDFLLKATGLDGDDLSKSEQAIASKLQDGGIYTLSDSEKDQLFSSGVFEGNGDLNSWGITKDPNSGSWSMETGREKIASMAFDDLPKEKAISNYNEIMHSGRDGNNTSEKKRIDMMTGVIDGMDTLSQGMSAGNLSEGYEAVGGFYQGMAKDGGRSVEGANDAGVHGSLDMYGQKYAEFGKSIADFNKGSEELADSDDLLKATREVGEDKLGGVDQSQLLSRVEKFTTGGTAASINAGKDKVKQYINNQNALTESTIDAAESRLSPVFKLNDPNQAYEKAYAEKAGLPNEVKDRIDANVSDYYSNIATIPFIGDNIMAGAFDTHMRPSDRYGIQKAENIAPAAEVYRDQLERGSAYMDLLESKNGQISEQSARILADTLQSGSIDQPQYDALKEEFGKELVDNFVLKNGEYMDSVSSLKDENIHSQRAFGLMLDNPELYNDFVDYAKTPVADRDEHQLDGFRKALQQSVVLPDAASVSGQIKDKVITHADIANGVAMKGMVDDYYKSMNYFNGVLNDSKSAMWFSDSDQKAFIDYVENGGGVGGAKLDAAMRAFERTSAMDNPQLLRQQLMDASSHANYIKDFQNELGGPNSDRSLAASYVALNYKGGDDLWNKISTGDTKNFGEQLKGRLWQTDKSELADIFKHSGIDQIGEFKVGQLFGITANQLKQGIKN